MHRARTVIIIAGLVCANSDHLLGHGLCHYGWKCDEHAKSLRHVLQLLDFAI